MRKQQATLPMRGEFCFISIPTDAAINAALCYLAADDTW
jgi:hypothetical protein